MARIADVVLTEAEVAAMERRRKKRESDARMTQVVGERDGKRLVLDWMAPHELIPHVKNYRTHPPAQMQALAQSLGESGWVMPVVLNKRTGMLIDGHARLQLALQRGEEEIPVAVIDVDEAQEERLLASLGKIADMAGIDMAKLKDLLSPFQNDPLGFPPGWAQEEIELLLFSDAKPAVPPPQAGGDEFDGAVKARAKAGDIWSLGEHRLAVGDCRDSALLVPLVGQDRCDLALVDPPYGNVAQDASGGYGRGALGLRHIEGDDSAEVIAALPGVLWPFLKKDAFALVFCQWRTYPVLVEAFAGTFVHATVIVWDKGRPGLSGKKGLAEAHEWLTVWTHGRPTEPGGFGGNVFSVGAVNRLDGKRLPHPHCKPIDLLKRALQQYSDAGARVFDPCAGSGSTMIACERTRRVCLAVELDPAYADVILARWEAETGREAERIAQGQTRSVRDLEEGASGEAPTREAS